jgi:integrase
MQAPKPDKRAHLTPKQIAELLAAAREHDDIRFKATKDHPYVRKGTRHPTPRYAAVEPVIRFLLLSGLRLGELVSLQVGDVSLEHGYFDVRAANTKTKRGRRVTLDVTPSLAALLASKIDGKKSEDRVFAEHTRDSLCSTMRRMHEKAPTFTHQLLRVTCATYLANMGGVGPVNEAFRLGHSVQIAQDFYLGSVRIDPAVKTLEEAMKLQAMND